jgi:hypothetical protein
MEYLLRNSALTVLTLLFPLIGSGQQLPVIADTELSSISPTKNFGTSPMLTVDSAHSVLLSFDLANLLPAGVAAGQINRARLILFPDAVTTNGSFKIVDVSGSWSEGTVTYSTKPALSSGSTTAAVTTAFTYVEVPLLALVQTWITNPSSNHGIELQGVGSTSFILDSKENTATSHPALLLVDVTGPAGPIGPQGPKGATGATGMQGPAGPQGPPGVTSLSHDGTLAGSGTAASPLALASPLPVGITAYNYTDNSQAMFGQDLSNVGGTGVIGYSGGKGGIGVVASGYIGIHAAGSADAGYFDGNVYVNGTLSKTAGSFKIDHPLDPENKYLYHSFVESPDMMNIYNGNVVTDGSGYAVVEMPAWFEALNSDFRYQLTPVGQFAQVMVASEIENGRFAICTDKSNVKVSWQVTGIRKDAYAEAHRIPVEEEKKPDEKGHYLYPELFGHAGEPGIAQIGHPRPTAPDRQ